MLEIQAESLGKALVHGRLLWFLSSSAPDFPLAFVVYESQVLIMCLFISDYSNCDRTLERSCAKDKQY